MSDQVSAPSSNGANYDARRKRETGRIPPHNLEAEESLIGAMMLSPAAYTAAVEAHIEGRDFYKPGHAVIYDAAFMLFARGEPVDPVTVSEELRRAGVLDAVGGVAVLRRIQAATPASANAGQYANIVAETSSLRKLVGTAADIQHMAFEVDDDVDETLDRALSMMSAVVAKRSADARQRLVNGATFVLSESAAVDAVWGEGDRVLWAAGEGLLVVGPTGVGKTTMLVQVTAARLGIVEQVLDLPVAPARRVLYLACDRPKQVQRAFARLLGPEHEDVLAERLVVWKGPPPRDFARHPETLAAMARDAGADCVVIDSLKDVALGLADDEVGAGLNSAMQHALAEGIDVAGAHHQRKGQAGSRPRTLEDVYGSTWITAGAGSVVLLWGSAGDALVELVHLKQPAAEVGPLRIDHDHNTGVTSVDRGDVDPFTVLCHTPNGLAARDLAIIQRHTTEPTENQVRVARRVLDRLVARNLAHRREPEPGGPTGTTPARYFAVAPEEPF